MPRPLTGCSEQSTPWRTLLDDARRCTARSKQSGQRCRRAAIVGGSVCHFHGGGAPQVRRVALRRVAEANAVRFLGAEADIVPVSDPVGALMHLAGEVEALRAILRDELAGADFDTADDRRGGQAAAVLAAYVTVLDKTLRVMSALARLDIADRRVTVEERTAEVLVTVIAATLADLGVDPRQEDIRQVVRSHLTALGACPR